MSVASFVVSAALLSAFLMVFFGASPDTADFLLGAFR